MRSPSSSLSLSRAHGGGGVQQLLLFLIISYGWTIGVSNACVGGNIYENAKATADCPSGAQSHCEKWEIENDSYCWADDHWSCAPPYATPGRFATIVNVMIMVHGTSNGVAVDYCTNNSQYYNKDIGCNEFFKFYLDTRCDTTFKFWMERAYGLPWTTKERQITLSGNSDVNGNGSLFKHNNDFYFLDGWHFAQNDDGSPVLNPLTGEPRIIYNYRMYYRLKTDMDKTDPWKPKVELDDDAD